MVNHLLFERLKLTPEVPVANGSMYVFKTERARPKRWRFSVKPDFLPATWAFSGTQNEWVLSIPENPGRLSPWHPPPFISQELIKKSKMKW